MNIRKTLCGIPKMKLYKPFKHIRVEYENYGVDGFYINFGNEYRNPHFLDIKKALDIVIDNWKFKVGTSLDLCAGGGEITSIIGCSEGCDPYTFDLYEKNTGKNCLRYSFDDIFNGRLNDEYDTIICSYALHLADKTKLPQIIYQLSCVCKHLLIISPTKKPEIDESWGFKIINEAYISGVRVRLFESSTST